MKQRLKFVLIAVGTVAIAGGLLWSFLAHRAELAAELQGDQPIKNPSRVTQNAVGEMVVKFDRETQQRMDIRTEALTAVTKRQQVAAYGHLEEDPSRSFVMRAPFMGNLREDAGRPWPNTGQTLAD